MRTQSIILTGKVFSKLSKHLNLGNGSTWPGHIALKLSPHFIEDIIKKSNTTIIMIAGTNGKTTTTSMIRTLLESNAETVIHNESGANLLNGIASTILLKASTKGRLEANYALFEIDENALPNALKKIRPDFLILLNLFRDQLDRYGEVNTIAKKWQDAIATLSDSTTLLLNADDPRIAFLGNDTKANVIYFSHTPRTSQKINTQAADSLYCPRCDAKLTYSTLSYSHLGNWKCNNCDLKRPTYENVAVPHFPLSGIYNAYNTTAAYLLAKKVGVTDEVVEKGLRAITPAFGRQEVLTIGDKKIQLFLSKNPTGFNESLRTINEQQAKHVLIALNDNTADGHDVSWIYDVDFEQSITSFDTITLSGTRAYDLTLRFKYADAEHQPFIVTTDMKDALQQALKNTPNGATLYVLPTYTAMLEIRKILTGRSIL